ncbi:MAG: YiiX/YebB-like N1pC/P60 family cysteine hydrolase [Candidatus Woesearchaeota archaeon]
MFRIFKEFYLIENFPKGYSWYKKIFSNIGFFFSRIIITPRKNKLTKKDLFKANLLLRKGDIILCGEHETVFSHIIGDTVNHTVIYVGKRRFVEAIGKGVCYVSFYKLFTLYHHLVILRSIKGTKRKIIRKIVKIAKQKVGLPYNYDFKKGDHYFCSELANEVYKEAGYKTGLQSISPGRTPKRKLQSMVTNAANALRPVRIIEGNFRVIFLSHELKLKGKKLVLKK